MLNNILLNGHVHMLEYVLEHWADAHLNLPLNQHKMTSVLHQAMCQAFFCTPDSYLNRESQSEPEENINDDQGRPVHVGDNSNY